MSPSTSFVTSPPRVLHTFLAASRVANVALRELGVVAVLLLLVVLLVKTKPLGLGSFTYGVRISLNTKHLYTLRVPFESVDHELLNIFGHLL